MGESSTQDTEMSLNGYQAAALTTRLESSNNLTYAILGLTGEAGEVAQVLKKSIRAGKPVSRTRILDEIGDVLWYVAAVADNIGVTLEQVAAFNLDKLWNRHVTQETSHANQT